ncbi:MAG: hypothetical protein LBI99_06085, partial [Propionibacteriaceae bacterium]|nr:hypothetical protein [Propionibacteriaceae bacterium]
MRSVPNAAACIPNFENPSMPFPSAAPANPRTFPTPPSPVAASDICLPNPASLDRSPADLPLESADAAVDGSFFFPRKKSE